MGEINTRWEDGTDKEHSRFTGKNHWEGIQQMIGAFAHQPEFEETIRFCDSQRKAERYEAELEL